MCGCWWCKLVKACGSSEKREQALQRTHTHGVVAIKYGVKWMQLSLWQEQENLWFTHVVFFGQLEFKCLEENVCFESGINKYTSTITLLLSLRSASLPVEVKRSTFQELVMATVACTCIDHSYSLCYPTHTVASTIQNTFEVHPHVSVNSHLIPCCFIVNLSLHLHSSGDNDIINTH